MRLHHIALLACALLLGGCASDAVFDARACPTEKTYTAEQQAQMATDLERTPPSIQGAMVDYSKLRDKARACRGKKVQG